MISWRLCLAFTVFFYSNSKATSCQRGQQDYDCPDSEKCCDNICRSSCSEGSDGATIAIVVLVCVCAILAKISCWACMCYRAYKRRLYRQNMLRHGPTLRTARPPIVIVRTTIRTPTASHGYTRLSEEDNTVEHGYINLSHDSPPGTILNQGDVITNPANNPPPP